MDFRNTFQNNLGNRALQFWPTGSAVWKAGDLWSFISTQVEIYLDIEMLKQI